MKHRLIFGFVLPRSYNLQFFTPAYHDEICKAILIYDFLDKPTMTKFIRKKSGINNWGLFAGQDFKKGDKVIEYKGKKYTHKQVEEDDRFDNSKAIYLFTLNKKTVLDGDTKSNTAKYINHTCDPNCEVDIIRGKIWILAIQDIKKGDELSYDYGFGYDEDYKQFRCKCGSKNCCGYIVRDDQRWRINRKFAKTKKARIKRV